MMPRRLLVAVAVALGGLATLTGCEKPSTYVTVVSGSSSASDTAVCYAHASGASVDVARCVRDSDQVDTVRVKPNSVLGVNVDPHVADNGYYLSLGGGEQQQIGPFDRTYTRVTIPAQLLGDDPAELRVIERKGAQTRGIWLFQLARD
jgi:hypothetical protein